MYEALKELEKVSSLRERELIEARSGGVPLIEYFGRFIPEALIRACGAGVYPLAGGGELAPPDAAKDEMLGCMNPLARSIAGGIKLGTDRMAGKADIVVTAVTDIHIGRLSELLEFWGVNVCKVGVPSDWRNEIAFEYYLNSIRRMLETVSRLSGKAMDLELARKYVGEMNRANAAFRHIKELRKRSNPPVSFENYMRLQHLSFRLCDTAVAAEAVESIGLELDGADGVYPKGAPRLMLAGRAVAPGDYELLRLLEESGAAVVTELLDDYVRVSDADIELDGDLLENFARSRYLDTIPIDSFQPSWDKRLERILSLCEEYGCDGVVWYQLAYDEVYDMEYVCLAKSLAERGIPLLRLETNYSYTPESIALARKQIANFVGGLRR